MRNEGIGIILFCLGALTSSCSSDAKDVDSAGASGTTGGTGGVTGSAPSLAACPVFPADNEWNRDISNDPLDPMSQAYIDHINNNGSGTMMHPDFGSGFGIPYVVVPGTEPRVPVSFDYADESDPGPYPIPADAPIEGGATSDGDRHILVVDGDACMLYELFSSYYVGPGWHAGSGAIFDLRSNQLRPDGWTSADAAGLPIFPGLVRYDEAVDTGEIVHALRFTVKVTQNAYVHPATHAASSVTDPNAPPMGMRIRLKASFDTSSFTGAALVVATALKKYGALLADNGSNWYFQGAPNPSFDDEELDQLKSLPGDAFEVVQLAQIQR
jgi:hypothetical protein